MSTDTVSADTRTADATVSAVYAQEAADRATRAAQAALTLPEAWPTVHRPHNARADGWRVANLARFAQDHARRATEHADACTAPDLPPATVADLSDTATEHAQAAYGAAQEALDLYAVLTATLAAYVTDGAPA